MNDGTKRTPDASTLRADIEKLAPDFRAALPAHIPLDRFKRALFTALQMTPTLASCDRRSFFLSCMRAANDGLLPDGREAVIVPMRDNKAGTTTAVYIRMIAGIYKLLRNSGELAGIDSQVIYENDEFAYEYGDNAHIRHKPAVGDRGRAIGAWAMATLKDGARFREIMSVQEIERRRAVSRAPGSPAWTQWWDEMACIRVVKHLAKKLPMSTDREYLRDEDDDRPEEPTDVTPQVERIAAIQSSIDSDSAGPPSEPAHDQDTGEVTASGDGVAAPAEQSAPKTADQALLVPVHPSKDGKGSDWIRHRQELQRSFRECKTPAEIKALAFANEPGMSMSPYKPMLMLLPEDHMKRIAAGKSG